MPLKLVPPRKGKTPNWSIRGTYLKVGVDRSCGTDRQAVARKILADLKGRIERGEYPEKAPAPKGKTFLTAAIAYMKAGGERENMSRLIDHFGEMQISEITQEAVDEAAIAILPNFTPATRNRKVYTPVSAVLHSAGIEIRLKRPKGAKGKMVTAFMSPQDAFAIIDAADAEEPAFGTLLRFLLYTGCRISEAMALRWEDVAFGQSLAYIGTSKNGDPRTAQLREDLRDELKAFGNGTTQGKVFPFNPGGGLKDRLTRAKLTVCGVKRKPRRKGESNADRRIPPHRLDWVGFHTFCHTWATWMRRYAKTDLQGLVATGRWRDPRSAARYAHVAARDEWSGVERLPTRGEVVESKRNAS